jgi:hypothetical protein
MSADWEIARVTGRCAATGRELTEGESYYAVLLTTPAGLERRDYSIAGWSGLPEGSFCHWRGRIPTRQKRQGPISLDAELLTQLFLRLEESDSEPIQQLRFVLGLLLMRKRLVRVEQTLQEGGREFWQLRLVTDQSLHQVPNPQLTTEQIDRLSAQLLGLLSGDVEAVLAEQPLQPAGTTNDSATAGDDASSSTTSNTERQENLATS